MQKNRPKIRLFYKKFIKYSTLIQFLHQTLAYVKKKQYLCTVFNRSWFSWALKANGVKQ